ncbi:MAG: hypothetical protein WC343_10215, partial [Bacilli bacterium]
MILTEEQREALYNALDYIRETKLPISGICEYDIAVIRAMIDSSSTVDYDGLRCESCGKTLKEIRGSKYAGDYCMGEIRLDPGQEASLSDPPIEPSYYFWCDECKNDSSEQIGEPNKLIAGFDLPGALADIERLRARDKQMAEAIVVMADGAKKYVLSSSAIMHVVFDEADSLVNYCEKLENMVIAKDTEIGRLREANTNFACQACDQAQKIERQAAWIKELEDALSEYQRLGKTIAGRVPCLVPHGDCGRCSADPREVCGALEQIAEGKIGPDAGVAHKECKECSDERLLASLVEHENQTHAILGAILGTDDTLENVAKRAMTRIAELEKWLKEERAGAIRTESYDHCEGMYTIDLPDAMIRAQQELQSEGKIGPGTVAPPCWQITEERKGCNRDLLANATRRGKILHEPPKQRRRARDAQGHVEGVRAMQMEMRTPVIKFRVEQDESGKIGYRVTKIEGFEEKKETDEEENEMQFTSTPRIYVRNENNHIILKIKSLMFTILTIE